MEMAGQYRPGEWKNPKWCFIGVEMIITGTDMDAVMNATGKF